MPGSSTDVVFTDGGSAGSSDTVTSIVDQPFTINSLTFNNTGGYQYLYLQNPSDNLNVNGTLDVDSGGTVSVGGGGANLTASSVEVDGGEFNLNTGATLAVTNNLLLGYGVNATATAVLNLTAGAELQIGSPANPIGMTVGRLDGAVDGSPTVIGSFAPNSTANPNMAIYITTLNIGVNNHNFGTGSAQGTVDLTNYKGPPSIGSLNIATTPNSVGNFTFGDATPSNLTIPDISIGNGNLNVNAGATLTVTDNLLLGYGVNATATAALNLAAGAGLQIGSPANPIGLTVGRLDGAVDGSATVIGSFAPDSTANPNMALYITTLNIGFNNHNFGTGSAQGTVDLTNYKGPLSIGSLNIATTPGSLGNFTFGNAMLSQLTIPTVAIGNGNLNVNAGATLTVTDNLLLGYGVNATATAALNLVAGAGLQIGSPENPIGMTVGRLDGAVDGSPTVIGSFAPNSTANPNMALYITAMNIGVNNHNFGTGSAQGTVDVTNYTGPLSIGSLNIATTPGSFGNFTFGNAVLSNLTIPDVSIGNGNLNINAGATLTVTDNLLLGYGVNATATAAMNLVAGAGLQVGSAANPIGMTVGRLDGAVDGSPTVIGSFAPNSTASPNMALYISALNIGVNNHNFGTGSAQGTVDLTNYKGPLNIGSLNIATTPGSFGNFTFGNAMLSQLTIPTVAIGNGNLTINSGATLHITEGMSLSPGGQFILGYNSAIDLTNSYMIIDYGSGPDPISTIMEDIISGYNHGLWNGPGINSSAAAANNLIPGGPQYGLGYADSADPGNPADLPPDTIEIRFTLLGDSNLDGTVNTEDFTSISQNLGQSGMTWDDGDFNYDGTVNAEDFTSFSHNLNQSAVLSSDLETANGINLANVPESACVGMMVIAGSGILRRRRRSSHR